MRRQRRHMTYGTLRVQYHRTLLYCNLTRHPARLHYYEAKRNEAKRGEAKLASSVWYSLLGHQNDTQGFVCVCVCAAHTAHPQFENRMGGGRGGRGGGRTRVYWMIKCTSPNGVSRCGQIRPPSIHPIHPPSIITRRNRKRMDRSSPIM